MLSPPGAPERPPNGERLLPGQRDAGEPARPTCLGARVAVPGSRADDCLSAAMCPLSSRMPFVKAELRITFEAVLKTLNLRAMYLESH